jgi:NADPH:quinone reductase-like Zn-dependent oxidoreductase
MDHVRAVRFDRYGGVDVLRVLDADPPVAGVGEAVVRVRAAGINPGEAKIRQGLLHERFPATFPSGQGSDLAGVVEALGPGVDSVAVGDEVIGFTDSRASHAELVLVEVDNLTARPAAVPWPVAGSLYVAGCTAWAAVRAVARHDGGAIVVSGAAGGVGSIAVQLARAPGVAAPGDQRDALVIGLASAPNHAWLERHGVVPVPYGDGVADRIRAAAPGGRVDAFIDTVGGGYVELALELGVKPDRIDTIADFAAVARYGVKADGNAAGGSAPVLAELARLVAAGELEVPIARTYPLEAVRDAYRELEHGHTHGKIVLLP